MRKKLYTIKGGILLLSILLVSSCRGTDTENTLISGGSSAVKFNLLGAEFLNSSSPASASLKKNTVSESAVQTHNILIDPSTFMSVKLSSATNGLKPLTSTSSKINPVAAVSGNPLVPGVKFRIIAYRQSNGDYHTHQDYIIGQTAIPMMLDNGAAYTIVVYSFGTTSLPAISAQEQSNISSAQVNYDDGNRDFMYQKIVYTPVNSTNTLNITLRHKVAQITTKVSSVSLGDITDITGGVLTPHYSNGVIPLSSGVMSGRTTATSGVPLSFTGTNTTMVTADPVFVNADTGGSITGGFSAEITIAGTTKTVSLPNSFKITPENKSDLTIKLGKCGAYVGPNDYKEIMCHNLGADTSENPFTPAAAVYGAKYQWGAQTGEAGRYYSQSDDQSNSGTISGWSTTEKPSGTWSNTSKTSNDPCPEGYRVPTKAQWDAIINNNNVERVGSWASSNGNYSSALYFRNSNGRTLMLPAAGYRYRGRGASGPGQLYNRGSGGHYWSSSGTQQPSGPSPSNYLYIYSSNIISGNDDRTYGFSVRCIAE